MAKQMNGEISMEREEAAQRNGASENGVLGETLSEEMRREMIAESAYYRAERRGFQNGDPVEDWLAAEEEIDEKLAQPIHRPSAIVLGLGNN